MVGHRWVRASAAILVGLITAGCDGMGSAEDSNASSAAVAFDHALSDPARACQLLAPGTLSELQNTFGPCPKALPQQQLPVSDKVLGVDVYGKDAIVHLDHDWVFLARFPAGWRVTAAGCVPVRGRPFSCTLKGQ